MRTWQTTRAACAIFLLAVAAATASAEPLKIMPLGDSITNGYPDGGGYRTKLWQRFGSSADNVDFLGSQQNGPAALGDKNHEGHNAYTIAYVPGAPGSIDQNIAAWLNASVNPDIILLMIGTNDIDRNYQVATAPDRLSQLIGKICDLKPDATLIVASIAPFANSTKNALAVTYNAAIPGVVSTHRSQGEDVYFFDMYGQLSTSDLLSDGIHPNAAGYDKMGDAWYAAIQSIPEPGSMALLISAGAAVAAVAWRRHSARHAF